jgi:hypothetical protein
MCKLFKSSIGLLVFAVGILTVRAQSGDSPRTLQVDGQPFFVKGITYGIKFNADELENNFKMLDELGANAIRTWGCGDDTQAILDMAEKHHIKVMLGIWMRHGRAGAEGIDNFNYVTDEAGKAKQRADALAWVEKFKDHPAVLCWGVGNEVTLNIATEPEKVAYAKFLEEVIQDIKKTDPKHPVASVSAWLTDLPYWQKYTPSIDIYGINTYGWGASAIPAELAKVGAKRPYFVTEFGPRGEWDAPSDSNGSKIEPGDQEKYDTIAKGFHDMIEKNKPKCVGAFVFNFGNSFDHTSLWLSLRSEGAYRPMYWATRQAFTGQTPEDYPKIEDVLVQKKNDPKKPGEWVKVMVKYRAQDRSRCEVSFAYNDRDLPWPDKDAVKKLESRVVDADKGMYEIQIPDAGKLIKLYALVRDAKPNLAEATISVKIAR